jgi:hypothetical protein
MLRRNHLLLSSSTLFLSIIGFILLSTTLTATTAYPGLSTSIEEARKWMDATKSTEQREELGPCNVSPWLGYLRSHIHLFLDEREQQFYLRPQPLFYSFYVQNVFQPYRSRLAEASSPSTSFCYLDKPFTDCHKEEDGKWGCTGGLEEAAVCFPNTDSLTKGTCVSCRNDKLKSAIENGTLKDKDRIADFLATCDPKSRGPIPEVPKREKNTNTTNEARYFRWLLESSYVVEGKKRGDDCSAGPDSSIARVYLDILMKKHFGSRSNVSLATPGTEKDDDERLYAAVREELMGSEEHGRKWWVRKLWGIDRWTWRDDFGAVYCSREEGLVCGSQEEECFSGWKKWNCMDCGDDGGVIMKNKGLMEFCGLLEGDGGKRKKNGTDEKNGCSNPVLGQLIASNLSRANLSRANLSRANLSP